MKTCKFQLKYGQGKLEGEIPQDQLYFEVRGRDYPALEDVGEAAKKALDYPLDAPPLREILKPSDRVVIVVSDITRTWQRMDLILPPLVEKINAAGVPDANITILVAVGGHRPNDDKEICQICGTEVAGRLKVVNHDPYDRDNMVYLGKTSRKTAVEINRLAVEADRLILTGGIIYHYMVGYGGGRKSVVPGICSLKTIQENHLWALGPTLGSGANPHCQSGKTKGNECHEDMMEAAAFLNPDFIVNVVPNPQGQIAGIFAGNWVSAWQEGTKLVDHIYAVDVPGRADIVIASAGGFPKDINLYQTGKAVDNAYWAVKNGGVVIMLSECPDIMEPPEFSEWFLYPSNLELERALRENFSIPGWVALQMLSCAERATCIMVTRPENTDFLKKAKMRTATSIEEALEMAYGLCGKKDPTVTLMPHSANTLPILPKEIEE